ncbi:LysM peptidoglycan-binding domain-containing protein [Hymenobacter setariae]|uniref:LysM peptidoglycan-binding domain-containing protein n=1 Tax=Hymenobacter setariae TaxID=2594794 RepID=A0A558BMP4_9BACT|nr:LysM peptidoglycan-binding domain-containing protein [Hymenobacter setariae]TVT37787.1 LysM peptidoglycan-binding domain-containing protein [Hymenobacter setariae]
MKVLHQVPASANRPALRGRLTGRLLVWALALGALPAAAQRVPRPQQAAPLDTVRQLVDLPAATIDSLAAEPLIELQVDSARLAWLQTPTTLQELVGDRMSCFETAAPHQFNNAVMAYVRLFTERQRGYTQRVLERRDFYFPIFEKYLAKYNLPDELKYLSVVESALIPTAKSGVGAVGLWQFMPPTANDLRLKRDEWVDERMHPEKATEAACKYLRDLYRTFHDWELVLAAYNWGTGNVQRVIRKTGKRNFWDMYPHMPAETRNYVPTFTAIMYAMTYAKEHDLHSPALRYQHYEQLDTLTLHGQALDLRRLSRALGYDDSLALARYNPELRRASLPAGYRPYVLRFPAAAREHLGDVDRPTLLAYCQPAAELPRPLSPLFVRLAGVEPWPTNTQLARTSYEEAAPRFRRLTHTLHRGQTLVTVAEKYHVSPAQLRKWNGLRKEQPLKPGRQLLVMVPAPVPSALAANQAIIAAAAPPPVTVATLRRAAPTDSTALLLAAANARYARQAQERAAREIAQAQELARVKKQLAARAEAQRRLSIAQAAVAAKATAATRLGMPTDSAATEATATVALVQQPARTTKRRETRVIAPQPELATTSDASLASEETVATPRLSRAALAEGRPTGRPQADSRRPREEKTEAATVLYTVRPGDNLTKLAQSQGVSIEQLKAWNKLTTETVMAGQQLHLAAPADATALPAVAQTPRHAKHSLATPALETHTVQPGDTLFSIAKRFGLTLAQLKRLNHLATDQVKPGQKLVVGG